MARARMRKFMRRWLLVSCSLPRAPFSGGTVLPCPPGVSSPVRNCPIRRGVWISSHTRNHWVYSSVFVPGRPMGLFSQTPRIPAPISLAARFLCVFYRTRWETHPEFAPLALAHSALGRAFFFLWREFTRPMGALSGSDQTRKFSHVDKEDFV